MKRIFTVLSFTFSIAVLLSASSCQKSSTFTYQEPIHRICLENPADSAHEEIFEKEITSATVRQVFASQNVIFDDSKINTVSLLSLRAKAEDGGTLKNIKSIRLLVRLVGASSDIEIAHSPVINSKDKEIFLIPDKVELRAFITELSILTLKIVTKEPSDVPVCIEFTDGVLKAEIIK